MNFKKWLLLSEKIIYKGSEFRDPLVFLENIYKTHPNPENLVVTFTEIDKVGINPSSKFDTPNGIYFYPIKYVIDKRMNVPYAGNQRYINVCEFTRPSKIMHMTSDASNQKGTELLGVFPREEVEKAIMKINPSKTSNEPALEVIKKAQEYQDYKKTKLNNLQYDQEKENDLYKKYIDAKNYYDNLKNELGVNYLDKQKKLDYQFRSDYSELWLVTKILSNNKPTQWSANFRKCGIDGFVDHGTGTIHTNEPIQGVVFEANALNRLFVVDKKYNTKTEISKYNLEKMTEDQIKNFIRSGRSDILMSLLSSAKDKDRIIELIIKNKKEFSDKDIEVFLAYTAHKDKTAEMIIQYKKELSDNNVFILLEKTKLSEEKDKIAEMIIQYKKELSDNDVYHLLDYAIDKNKIAELLQKERDNISRLSFFDIKRLFKRLDNQKKLVKIIDTYHKNKTPEIQNLIDQYLF